MATVYHPNNGSTMMEDGEDLDPDYRRCMMEDLQLAAELGKTLLERNKELESTLRKQQSLINDQTQEIEYLTKQTAALREVNDSRLRIYEQLEVSIQDLERNNQRLATENVADKKQIKSLCQSLDTLETRCEELTRAQEEAQAAEKRRSRSPASTTERSGQPLTTKSKEVEEHEELASQVALLRAQKTRETKRAEELEEQLTSLIQENATLEGEVSMYRQKDEQFKSLEEEISSLQKQQVCFRCMHRQGGTNTPSLMDEDVSSSVLDDDTYLDDETDLETEVQSIASETHNTVLSDNPYRVLVEKYEALLSMQRRPAKRPGVMSKPINAGLLASKLCMSPLPAQQETNCMSLQEELQLSGEFSSGPVSLLLEDYSKVEPGEQHETNQQQCLRINNQAGTTGQQLYFSEAETNSSSGVSEGDVPRQQHRATQTNLMSGGGKLLWSISAGGADCVVNVYDEGDPTESRFQRAPEYRELFSEIFTVLKRSVERSSSKKNAAVAVCESTPTGVTAASPGTDTKSIDSKIAGQADAGDSEAGKIEEVITSSDTAASSILSLSGQPRKSRKSKSRKAERKTEPLRRKVLSLSPERLTQQQQQQQQQEKPLMQQFTNHQQPGPMKFAEDDRQSVASSRDQSPALSERSDRSKKGRHWSKRGRPLVMGSSMWPWSNRWQQHPAPQSSSTSVAQVQYNPSAPGPSSSEAKPPTTAFVSTASADVARLKQLEKSYADALRLGPAKQHRRK